MHELYIFLIMLLGLRRRLIRWFISCVGHIAIIREIMPTTGARRNVTCAYYMGWLPKNQATYYATVYSPDVTHRFICRAPIQEISARISQCVGQTSEYRQRKPGLLFFDGAKTLNFDLQLLDQFCQDPNLITDLPHVMCALNINCTHLEIIKMWPFSQSRHAISDMQLAQLY